MTITQIVFFLVILLLCSCSSTKKIPSKITGNEREKVLLGTKPFQYLDLEHNFHHKHLKEFSVSNIDMSLIKVDSEIVNGLLPESPMKDRHLNSSYYYSSQNKIGPIRPLVFYWNDPNMADLLELVTVNDSGKFIDQCYLAVYGGHVGIWTNAKSYFINDSVFVKVQITGEESTGRTPGFSYVDNDSTRLVGIIRASGKIDTLEYYHESKKDSSKF